MPCLSLNIICVRPAALAVATATMAAVGVQPVSGAALSVQTGPRTVLSTIHAPAATLAVVPMRRATLKVTPIKQDGGQTPGPRPSTARLMVTPVVGMSLAALPLPQAKVSAQTGRTASVSVTALPKAMLAVTPASQVVQAVVTAPTVRLRIAEVCSIGSGELFVLATQEGPLRTQNGGFLLLDPAGETD